ncbi:MAG: hypothetical protein PVI57_08970 [Gemmatimonadota bacterium]|jgi:tetratricopeptide (TPR) repeat protein
MADAVTEKEERPEGVRTRLPAAVVALLLPVAILAAVEGVLRLVGYGGGRELIVPFEQVPGYLMVNPAVGARYFADPEGAYVPSFEVFPARREPGDVRLVFQGASTGVGFPYDTHAAPARAVENRLREIFPERRIDVINTSMTAVNSYTLLDLGEEIARLEPDAVLIYAGHNEYYGALGVGSAESVGRRRWLVLTYIRLSDLRLFQLLRNVVHALRPGPAGPPGTRGGETPMDRLAGEEAIPFESELYRAGLQQYRANLSDLLALYADRGIPVLVATLVSNERDLPPFVGGPSTPSPPAVWPEVREAAATALERGDTTTARTDIDELLGLDSLAADPWYLRGRLEDGLERWDAARRDYVAARDRDQLRFRAPSAFNRIVREVAAEHGARVVEVEEAFRAASPHGIVGSELVTEHVHPDLRGYAILAHTFLEALRDAGIPDGWDQAPELGPPGPRPPLVTALDTVRAAYRLRALRQGWPFRPRADQEPLTVEPRTVVDTLAVRLYRREMLWMQAMRVLAEREEEAGDLEDAYLAQRAMAAEFPVIPHFFADAARLAVRLGREDEAERLLREAAERGELPLTARVEGALRLRQGRVDEAMPLLEGAAARGDARAATLLDSLASAAGG